MGTLVLGVLLVAVVVQECTAEQCKRANWADGFGGESQPTAPCSQLVGELECQTRNLCCYSHVRGECIPSNLWQLDCVQFAVQSDCDLLPSTACQWSGSSCNRVCPFTSSPQLLCQAVVFQAFTNAPAGGPTLAPVLLPPVFTRFPTVAELPVVVATDSPATTPSIITASPDTDSPTTPPSIITLSPMLAVGTGSPVSQPATKLPTRVPTFRPTNTPTLKPTSTPTKQPTSKPSKLATAAPTPSKRTNFVLMLADDLGWGDVSFNGGFKPTPFLQEMASSTNTLQFSNFHSGSPVCSPSRAAMLAGQYPDRNCVSGPTTGLYFQAQNNTPTIALDAKRAGYATLFLGKWHLSGVDNDFIGRLGFDQWTGSYGNILTYDAPCSCPEVACKQTCSPEDCAVKRVGSTSYCMASGSSGSECELGSNANLFTSDYPPFFECGMKTKTNGVVESANMPRNTMSCDFLVDKFQDFLDSRNVRVPFLAVLNFHEVHRPFVADPKLRLECESGSKTCTYPPQKMAANSAASNYYSVIESLDAAVGRVRSLLKKYALDQDTLVVFTSDNGPETALQGGAGTATPFQGMKRSLYEGGHRVPALIESTKYVTKPGISPSLVSLLDLRPTIRDILELENPALSLPREPVLDGVSLLDLFGNPAGEWTRPKDLLICLQVSYNSLVLGRKVTVCESYAYIRANYKIIVTRDAETKGHGMMFNLANDPGETANLAAKQSTLFNTLVQAGKVMVANARSIGYHQL
ncbi:hypothetical protein BASA81_010143 [Batrachochytrium salamandrivorans]|nr:hypothetical protein BASA81_010143 [Batrachochytrium salamandrivorans]